jgi:hypothetical protein
MAPRLPLPCVLLHAVLLASCGAPGGRRDAPAAAPAKVKVVAVSDSLTNDKPENWLALLGGMDPRLLVVAEAHGGWTTHSYFKSKFDGIAFAKVPRDADVFILLLGSNNLFEAGGGSDAAVEEATAGIERIAAHVLGLSPKAKFVLAAPPNVCLKNYKVETPKPPRRMEPETPAYLQKLGRSYRALADRRGWRFVDLFPLLGDEDFVDAAHPGPAGNRKMAEAIGKAVAEILPRP